MNRPDVMKFEILNRNPARKETQTHILVVVYSTDEEATAHAKDLLMDGENLKFIHKKKEGDLE